MAENLPLQPKKSAKRPGRPVKTIGRRRDTPLSAPKSAPSSYHANVPQISRRRQTRKSSDSHGDIALGLVGLFLVASMAFWLFVFPLL
jgi:hypothetical protein